jgi:hypothetical protein
MKLFKSLSPREEEGKRKKALQHIYYPELFQLQESIRPDFEAINKIHLTAFWC